MLTNSTMYDVFVTPLRSLLEKLRGFVEALQRRGKVYKRFCEREKKISGSPCRILESLAEP